MTSRCLLPLRCTPLPHICSLRYDLPKPPVGVRNLIELARYGHLCSTMSGMHHRRAGYPFGTLIDFAADGAGYPIFCLSPLAIHSRYEARALRRSTIPTAPTPPTAPTAPTASCHTFRMQSPSPLPQEHTGGPAELPGCADAGVDRARQCARHHLRGHLPASARDAGVENMCGHGDDMLRGDEGREGWERGVGGAVGMERWSGIRQGRVGASLCLSVWGVGLVAASLRPIALLYLPLLAPPPPPPRLPPGTFSSPSMPTRVKSGGCPATSFTFA